MATNSTYFRRIYVPQITTNTDTINLYKNCTTGNSSVTVNSTGTEIKSQNPTDSSDFNVTSDNVNIMHTGTHPTNINLSNSGTVITTGANSILNNTTGTTITSGIDSTIINSSSGTIISKLDKNIQVNGSGTTITSGANSSVVNNSLGTIITAVDKSININSSGTSITGSIDSKIVNNATSTNISVSDNSVLVNGTGTTVSSGINSTIVNNVSGTIISSLDKTVQVNNSGTVITGSVNSTIVNSATGTDIRADTALISAVSSGVTLSTGTDSSVVNTSSGTIIKAQNKSIHVDSINGTVITGGLTIVGDTSNISFVGIQSNNLIVYDHTVSLGYKDMTGTITPVNQTVYTALAFGPVSAHGTSNVTREICIQTTSNSEIPDAPTYTISLGTSAHDSANLQYTSGVNKYIDDTSTVTLAVNAIQTNAIALNGDLNVTGSTYLNGHVGIRGTAAAVSNAVSYDLESTALTGPNIEFTDANNPLIKMRIIMFTDDDLSGGGNVVPGLILQRYDIDTSSWISHQSWGFLQSANTC